MLGSYYEEWAKIAPRHERPRASVDEKLQLLADKQRIEEMILEYGLACDSRDWDRLRELYDENIEREIGGTIAETVRGRENLIALHAKPVLPRAEGIKTVNNDLTRYRNREIRHLISTKVIRIGDDDQQAWSLCYYQMAVVGQDDTGWHRGEHEGTYIFSFKKASGQWRFTRHLIWTNFAVNPMFSAPAK